MSPISAAPAAPAAAAAAAAAIPAVSQTVAPDPTMMSMEALVNRVMTSHDKTIATHEQALAGHERVVTTDIKGLNELTTSVMALMETRMLAAVQNESK